MQKTSKRKNENDDDLEDTADDDRKPEKKIALDTLGTEITLTPIPKNLDNKIS